MIKDMFIMDAKWEGILIEDCNDFEIIDTYVIVSVGVTTIMCCRNF